jgi:catalase (peroxidase I)
MFFIHLLITLVFAQDKNLLGSVEATQAAAKNLQFIINAPRNCLEAIADLPNSVSKNMAALWIRAAFHDGGTFAPGTANPGGLDSSVLSFLNVSENAGLADSMATNFVRDPNITMTKADKIALGAQVAVTHCGGPSMPFRSGRKDAVVPVSPVGRLPSGNDTLESTRKIFQRMGWTNEDIVVLVTGSHTMG